MQMSTGVLSLLLGGNAFPPATSILNNSSDHLGHPVAQAPQTCRRLLVLHSCRSTACTHLSNEDAEIGR